MESFRVDTDHDSHGATRFYTNSNDHVYRDMHLLLFTLVDLWEFLNLTLSSLGIAPHFNQEEISLATFMVVLVFFIAPKTEALGSLLIKHCTTPHSGILRRPKLPPRVSDNRGIHNSSGNGARGCNIRHASELRRSGKQ